MSAATLSLDPTYDVIAASAIHAGSTIATSSRKAVSTGRVAPDGKVKPKLLAPLRDGTGSALLDVTDVFNPDTDTAVAAGASGVALDPSVLLGLIDCVAASPPARGPHRVILAASCAHRVLKARYVCVGDAATYAVGCDDSFVVLALSPGVSPRVVRSIRRPVADAPRTEELSRLERNAQYALLPVCCPVGNWDVHCDYHSLLLLFAAARALRELACSVGNGDLEMCDGDGEVLMQVTVAGGVIETAMADTRTGALSLLATVLTSAECTSPRIDRLVRAERELGIGSHAIRVAVVVCQTAEERVTSPDQFNMKGIEHSRLINHSLGFTEAAAVERAVELLADDGISDVLSCQGFQVTIGNDILNLEETCSLDEHERDHDNRGMLNVPMLGNWATGLFSVRVGAVKLRRGLGMELGATDPSMSYWVRGKQNTVSIREGMFYGHVQIDLKRDLFFFTKVRRAEAGIEHVGMEIRDGRRTEPLDDAIVNGLLGGGHGTPIARWIWAKIDSGAVKIKPESSRLCFFGNRINTSPDGHDITGPIAGRAVGECVVYHNTETKKIYVDKRNVGELMEVVATEGGLSHLVPAPDAESDRSNLYECFIADISRFCDRGKNCPNAREPESSASSSHQ